MSPFGTAQGTVASFDEHKGYGTVADETGTELPFHCTAIADGSRSIDVGRAVEYDRVAGRAGRWEATNLRPR